MSSNLVAILHSRPVGSGARTLARVEIARRTLGCDSFSVANVYPALLERSGCVSDDDGVWRAGRDEVKREVARADTTDVLLGYGVNLPTGAARAMYRAQMEWLDGYVASTSMRVWTFGGRPHHPSRWQRVAFRHRTGATVEELAGELLAPITRGGPGGAATRFHT